MALTAARATPDEDSFEYLDSKLFLSYKQRGFIAYFFDIDDYSDMDDCDFSTLNCAPFAPAITTTQADEDDDIYYSCNEESDFEDDEYDEDEPEGS